MNDLASIRARDKATSFQAMDGKRSPAEIDRRDLIKIIDRLQAGIRKAADAIDNYDYDTNLFDIQDGLEELLMTDEEFAQQQCEQQSEEKHEAWLLRKLEQRNEQKSDDMRIARFEQENEQ